MSFIECRECGHRVSKFAYSCPGCGVPHPADEKLDSKGFEYKSKTTVLGLPLVHVSFKYRLNGAPVPAKGIIAIGQFAIGVINISQFGIGVISLSQFAISGYALAQITFAYSCKAQVGIYIHQGFGSVVWKLSNLLY